MENLSARTIYFRLINENDAEFICSLRSDPYLNAYLSTSDNRISVQEEWIRKYKSREQKKQEFYFIICRKKDDLPIGTVRLYDFLSNPASFCWGSWILNKNKTQSSALESALLVYKFGFDYLGFEQSHFDVRKENIKVNSFHKKMGAIETSRDSTNIYYILDKNQYNHNKEYYHKKIL